jgi:pimeloyl-ACP methyl ester carboxylesterase
MRDFLSAAHALPSVEALIDAAHGLSPRTDRATLAYRYHYMTERTDAGWRFRHDHRKRPDFPHIVEKLVQLEQLAAQIQAPLLMARGARSRVLGDEAARAFAARFRVGRHVTIDDAGHNVQEDNPRALAAALRAHFEASWLWDDTRSSHFSSR